MALRDLDLIDASVTDTATLAEAVAELFEARVPAVAVLGENRRVLGILSERDVLKAVFPTYLAELRHSAFLPDDSAALEELAMGARGRSVSEFVRTSEVLQGADSQVHAAERLLHSGDDALPVVEEDRFIGMLSVAGLCHARLDRRHVR
jgi:CBS domain-containing protein